MLIEALLSCRAFARYGKPEIFNTDLGSQFTSYDVTEEQIAFALKQADTGTKVAEICREMGKSPATFYAWRKKYGGMGVAELRRLKQLEHGNRRLKQLVADLSLDKEMLQEVVRKKL